MKLPRLFIFQNAVFLLFLYDSVCAPSQTSGKQIENLVQEFKYLGAHFTNSVLGSTKPNQNILIEVKAAWQQRLVDNNLSESVDYFTKLELRKEMARILFILLFIAW